MLLLETLHNQVFIFTISPFYLLVVFISNFVFSHGCDVLPCQVPVMTQTLGGV